MNVKRTLFDLVIRFQQSLPFSLPNEYLAWHQYTKKFSKKCDGCTEEKGVYKITYQDNQVPSTVIYPFPVRLCPNCLAKADDVVGILGNRTSEDEDSFEINRV